MATNASEISAEQSTLAKLMHVPLKKWFNADPKHAAEFGKYPDFWRDLLTWQHFRAVRKRYLTATEKPKAKPASAKKPASVKKEAAGSGGGSNGAAAGGGGGAGNGSASSSSSSASGSVKQEPAPAPTRKRRSRWGANDDAKAAPANAAPGGAAGDDASKRRRTRWSQVRQWHDKPPQPN